MKKTIFIFLKKLEFIIKNYPKIFTIIIFSKVIVAAKSLMISVFFIDRICKLIVEKQSFNSFILYLIQFMVILGIFEIINLVIELYFLPQLKIKIEKNINFNLFEHSINVELKQAENSEFYDTYVFTIDNYVNNIFNVIDIFSDFIASLFTTITLIFYLKSTSFILILIIIISIFSGIYFGKKLNIWKLGFKTENQKNIRKLNYVKRIIYLKEYAIEYKISKVKLLVEKICKETLEEYLKLSKKYLKKIGVIRTIQEICSQYIVLFSALIYCVFMIFNNTFGISRVLPSINAILTVSVNLYVFTIIYNKILACSMEINKIEKFLKETEQENPEKKKKINTINTIKFENVYFSYENQLILKNVSFEINNNEKVSIIGYNGSGKTTLIKLILGFYKPDSGEIYINGINIKEIDIKYLYPHLNIVFQDFNIYQFKIIDNILMKNYNKKDEETALYAINKTGIKDVIYKNNNNIYSEMSKEYDNNGVLLSGGQMEKIALSRVFSKTSIAILDEPTQALDSISEYNIMKEIMEHCKNNIVVYITHRLTNCIYSDKIILLENGEIIEQGSHIELMEKGKKYYEMYCLQDINNN